MAGVDSDPNVEEIPENEHRQALERHDLYEDGVDTKVMLEEAQRRREVEE